MEKQTKIWPILLAIVLTAVIVGGEVYYWQNLKSQATPTDTTTTTVDETKDWNAQNYPSLGYSIKYPMNEYLTVITKEGENAYQLQAICISEGVLSEGTEPRCNPSIGVHNTTLAEEIKYLSGISGKTEQKEITFAGQKAIELSYEGEMDGTPLTTILVPFNNFVYDLSYEQSLKSDPTLSKILSTFSLFKASILSMPTPLNNTPSLLTTTPVTGTKILQDYKYSYDPKEGFTSLTAGNYIWLDKVSLSKILANEESISSFFAPILPNNKDVLVFSTSGKTTGTWNSATDPMKSSNKIYVYDTKTNELTKIYEENEGRLLRTMGMEGTKLIVLFDGIDNSPGPCVSIWLDYSDKFGYLELSDVTSGFKKYTVPQYKIDEGKAEQTKCEAELQ